MKRYGWIALVLMAAMPMSAASKLTVAQLRETLVTLEQAQKDDADVASKLMTVELTEQLTRDARKGLAQYLPGPLSRDQADILEGRSAFLAPPATELPTAAAPDAAAQKAILAKAADYASKTYMQNPHLTATKVTSRFQDETVNTSSTPGLVVAATNSFQRKSEARTEPVEIDHGIEKPSASQAKTKWGENHEISEGDPGLNLGAVVQEAEAGGKIEWLRWETIDGKQAAVFSFAVDKKKAHYAVSYCCFPSTDTQSGIAASGTFAPIPGEIQSVTTWRPFKKVVGYHGELYIDPESGTVVRVVARADLKPTEYVHQEMVRIDYGPILAGVKQYEAPIASYVVNEVVPGGDSGTGAIYSVRHTLLIAEYISYR